MKFTPIKSSNLVEASYDGISKAQVRFKNGLYANTIPLPPELYARFAATFQTAESSGAFFNKHLRSFGFKKVV